MVALAGLWGPEKPNIALNLTYRHLADSKVAFWVLADSAEKIGIGFGETAQLLSLPKGTLSASQVQALVIGDYQEEGHPRAIILSRHLDSTTSEPGQSTNRCPNHLQAAKRGFAKSDCREWASEGTLAQHIRNTPIVAVFDSNMSLEEMEAAADTRITQMQADQAVELAGMERLTESFQAAAARAREGLYPQKKDK
ncbi:hypothetical protein S40285_10545 [Stachybotrys chlorohalonatus IBT 40285]|uniref:Uncharacterized protein n=1 Tax=Stachybotrys chlorohalonatus (strain IBT 40285) TaxID=1283841 RepID=A0A084R2G4_STAC4|nr:hypothetical protein S40285_10545 [Stachybotrys chlorohalonata IBT 40285]